MSRNPLKTTHTSFARTAITALTAAVVSLNPLVPALVRAESAQAPAPEQATAVSAAERSIPADRVFPQTGFGVERDSFWSFFQHRGGLRTFGYPVSYAFPFLGCDTQFFQRIVLQQCGGGAVATLNLLDDGLLPYTRINGSTLPAIDPAVVAQAPAPGGAGYGAAALAFITASVPDTFEGEPVGFLSTFLNTVTLEDAYPSGGGDASLLPLLNLELWGLPVSRPVRDPNNGGFIYQRFQRGVMHYDASTGATQGLLLADYLKALITGEGLPGDLEAQAAGSPLYRSAAGGLIPAGTSYAGAFSLLRDSSPTLQVALAPVQAASGAQQTSPQSVQPAQQTQAQQTQSGPATTTTSTSAAPAAGASNAASTSVPTATPKPAATPAPAARPAGQFLYGAVIADPKSNARVAKAAGMTHMSAYVPWKNVEPQKGHYLFKQMESWGEPVANDLTNVITAARQAGLKVVLRLDEPPAWAGGKMYRLDPADVERYVDAVVSYGRGTITHVEVFNEPNLPFEWGTSPVDPAAYTRLLAAAYRGARRADTSVQVVSAALSPRTGGYGGTMEDVDFLEGVYRAGGARYFDLLGLHAYLGNFAPEADSSCVPMCFRTIELLRAVMEQHGDAGKGALITEIGTLEATPQDLGAYEWMELASERRGEYLVGALQLANRNYPWIKGALVFNLDYATTPWVPASSPMHWFSLLNADKSPRPAYNKIKDARASGALS